MEWCFETSGGAVTVRQEGDRAVCQAIRSVPGDGLYKGWLRGQGNHRCLLGTLIPEGGALRLRRNIPVARLREQGVWPPAGAEIAMSFPFAEAAAKPRPKQPPPPAGFQWEEKPWNYLSDPLLIACLQRGGRCLIQKGAQGFLLALPFDPGAPFPLPPLFCLSRMEKLDGQNYFLFSFSPEGKPLLPHDFLADGDTTPRP